ncbi:MAG: hypothetical protein WC777_03555 [Candidatus Gracilibacteria bacterium]|jgi:hypothetical protein
MSHNSNGPENPDNDVEVDPLDVDGEVDMDGEDGAPVETNEAPEGSLPMEILGILQKNATAGADIEALTFAANSFASRNERAVQILTELSDEEKMALMEKGLTGLSFSRFEKIVAVLSPGAVLGKKLVEALWGGLKRNFFAKFIPDPLISDISMLVNKPTVAAMFSLGIVPASTEVAAAADQAFSNFIKTSKTAGTVLKVGGMVTGHVEATEAGELIQRGVTMGNLVVERMPKVREHMNAERAAEAEAAAQVQAAQEAKHAAEADAVQPEVALDATPGAPLKKNIGAPPEVITPKPLEATTGRPPERITPAPLHASPAFETKRAA